MNYRVKRIKVGLAPYTVAKELGIDLEKYLLVEKKKLPLEGELVDKFLNIVDPKNAKMIKMNRIQRLNEIKEFAKNGNFKKLMKDRGYKKQTDLSKATGVSDSEISRIINYGEVSLEPGDNALERVYDFLMNPLNRKVEEEKVRRIQENNLNLLTIEEREKYRKLIKKYNLKMKDIGEAIGYARGSVSSLLSPNSYASPKCKEEFVEYMKQYELMETKEGIGKLIEPKEKENTVLSEEQNEYYTKLMDENFISRKKVAHDLGYSVSTINNLFSKEYYGGGKVKDAFIEYMKQYENKVEEVAEETIEEPINEAVEENTPEELQQDALQGVSKDWVRLLNENHQLKNELDRALVQLRRYEKLIDRM